MFTLRQGGFPDRQLPAGVLYEISDGRCAWRIRPLPGSVVLIATTESIRVVM